MVLISDLGAGILEQTVEQTSSKGLRVSLVKDPSLLFIHAELAVYYSDISNPSIPYLTLMSIFDDQTNNPQTGLRNILFKMGNDYKIDYKLDHFIIKINFLRSDIKHFVYFLKSLYSYKDFSLKKFNYSIRNFWDLFRKRGEWKQVIAAQVAFGKLFKQDHSGKFLISRSKLKNLNLSHIRSFFKNNYILANSFLTLRGDIRPYFVFGLIEKVFNNFKNRKPNYGKFKYKRFKNNRKIIIVDINENISPCIYWIYPASSPDKMVHYHNIIANNILFGYPFGRISRNVAATGIRNFNITNLIHYHRNISILCNKIRINYKDMEKFIFIADSTINKFGRGRLNRKEYLDSYNFIFQKTKIDSDNFEIKAMRKIAESFIGNLKNKVKIFKSNLLKNLNYEDFLKNISGSFGIFNANKNRQEGIIVIFGNAKIIKKYLRIMNKETIKLF